MGQKTNPNILRLGITKNWKVEFFEKKNKELPLYIFNDLEIYEYIERFLKVRGIFLHDYRQFYNNKTLNLYISYFVTPKKIFKNKIVLKKITPETSKHFTNDVFKCLDHNMSSSFQEYRYFISYSNDFIVFTKTLNDAVKTKNFIIKFLESSNFDFFQEKSLVRKVNRKNKVWINLGHDTNWNSSSKIYSLRARLKPASLTNNILDLNSIKLKNDLKNILKVINNYTKHKFDIIINFSCINKDFTNYFSTFKNKKIRMLQRFKFTPFFKEGWELLFHVSFNSNSARLLSIFIAEQLKILKIKQLNFFFAFIKRALTVLISSNLSKLKGVKVIIKGRLSKNIRAKHKILTVGDVAVQTLDSHIDYHQTTIHNANGSYGVKVWIVEK